MALVVFLQEDKDVTSVYRNLKVFGPFVETPRIFLCMQNINYAEILAWKNDYCFKIISDRGLPFVPALLYSNESLNLDLVNTRSRAACWYRQTLVHVAVNNRTVLYPTIHQYIACIHSYCPCNRIANVRVPKLFFWGGGQKYFIFFI